VDYCWATSLGEAAIGQVHPVRLVLLHVDLRKKEMTQYAIAILENVDHVNGSSNNIMHSS
jgi:hypothetical protein